MKINCITEGLVNNAKGDIINTKNEVASIIATAMQNLGYPNPDTEFSNTIDDDAIIMVELGRSVGLPISQILSIEVTADDDITIRVPSMLSEVINIHDYHKLNSAEETIQALNQIKDKIKVFSSRK